ncbi:unnamed protein product [Arabis nemorensis]|uniref:Uncharacterized protein n=1 Tax=Arabis nemorensis TaxID=586526 RepID=A0A565AWT2_9BRAS|nr:unnamed protein product [Arabis nemorensis]
MSATGENSCPNFLVFSMARRSVWMDVFSNCSPRVALVLTATSSPLWMIPSLAMTEPPDPPIPPDPPPLSCGITIDLPLHRRTLLLSSLKSVSSTSSLERPLPVHCALIPVSPEKVWAPRRYLYSYLITPKNLSNIELMFSGFKNLASSTIWLRSDLLSLYAMSLTILSSYVDVRYGLGFMSSFDSTLLVWFCSQWTRFRLSKSFASSSSLEERILPPSFLSRRGDRFSVSKPKNFSSFMERDLLSSMLMALVGRAMYDHDMVVGLKKVDFKSASLQNSASRSLMVWDLVVDILLVGCVLSEASDKVSRVSNVILGSYDFGSLLISKNGTTKSCISIDSIKLLSFYAVVFLWLL